MHSERRHVTVIALIALISGACTHPPTGPSLSSVTLDSISLQPTEGNASLCCCRVVGGATNHNSATVHATIKFAAFSDSDPTTPLGTIVYFLKDLQPNQRQAIEASGFLFSCAQAKQVKTEIDVVGLDSPPPD
jgi:hypothetical protein